MTENGGVGGSPGFINVIEAMQVMTLQRQAMRRKDHALVEQTYIALGQFLDQFDEEYRGVALDLLSAFVTLSTRLEEMQVALKK